MSDQYKSIAKSSSLIAIVQVVQMFFGLIRNKAVAILIGTNGFGIWSLYQTFLEMMTSFSTLGMDQGGVREISKVTNDDALAKRTVFTFQLSIFIISLVSAILILVFSNHISQLLFGSTIYSKGIKFLSLTVVVYSLAKSSYSILNGYHALKYIAYSQILAAVLGSLGAVAIIFFTHDKYITLALSVVFIVLAIFNTFYVIKLKIGVKIPSLQEYITILRKLLNIGFGFTVAGLISTVMTLLSREYLNSHYLLESVGIYQASFTVSNIYVGVILSAMGVDFLPKLAKVSDDNDLMNDMINRQIEFGIVAASIGISLVVLFAPHILTILYSPDFLSGTSIIRWQIIGVTMRIIAFPFSYAIIAKGKPVQYALTQILFWVSDYLLLMLFSKIWGFASLGINYCVAYILYLLLTYLATKYNTSFSFTTRTKKSIIVAILFISIVWGLTYFIGSYWLYIIGGFIWAIHLNWVIKYLKNKMSIDIISLIKVKLIGK